MRWIVVVVLILVGLFYLGREFMPNARTIDAVWVKGQLKNGMNSDQVLQIAGEPTQRQVHQVGYSEVWSYTDRYDQKDRLIVHFVDHQVYRIDIEDN